MTIDIIKRAENIRDRLKEIYPDADPFVSVTAYLHDANTVVEYTAHIYNKNGTLLPLPLDSDLISQSYEHMMSFNRNNNDN